MKHGQLAVLVGTRPPVTAVIHHTPAADLPHDSGYTVLLADAPHASQLADDDPRLRTVCLHCLIDRHPEAGRGLDLAREHGEAARDPNTSEWHTPEQRDTQEADA